MLRNLSILLAIFIFILGCTKDDICSEETNTTSLLVIDFRDINDRTTLKSVTNLRVLLDNLDSTVVISSVSDTIIQIPLNTEANNSNFIFIQNSTSEDNSNADNVSFNYDTEESYINRACSFKVIYNNLVMDVEEEANNGNWILDTEILNPIVENENEAHITIYH